MIYNIIILLTTAPYLVKKMSEPMHMMILSPLNFLKRKWGRAWLMQASYRSTWIYRLQETSTKIIILSCWIRGNSVSFKGYVCYLLLLTNHNKDMILFKIEPQSYLRSTESKVLGGSQERSFTSKILIPKH